MPFIKLTHDAYQAILHPPHQTLPVADTGTRIDDPEYDVQIWVSDDTHERLEKLSDHYDLDFSDVILRITEEQRGKIQ